ncbi:cytochrome P450 [Myxococcota bacterium]|nr:cytochrome P450 [Myxococcota bacterium]
MTTSGSLHFSDYDPYTDAVMRDPWPFYAALRRDSPVHYLEQYDTWFLSRFEDIWQATTQDMFTAERGVTPEMVLLKRPPAEDPVFSMLDVPRQRDYRRMLAPRYTRRATNELETFVRTEARALIEPLAANGAFDVYTDYAAPLSARVIGHLIGLPTDLSLQFAQLVEAHFRRHSGQVGASDVNNAAMAELMPALMTFIEEQRGKVSEDDTTHIAALLNNEAEGKPLSLGSIVATLFTLLVTGIEVVPLAVANTAVYLAKHPDQRSQLVKDPRLIPLAFDESLRYDQPTNLLGRVVKQEVTIGEKTLRAGQGVMFLWASGNRDEAEFDNADQFDITRRPRRSLSYGHGVHKCIGEHLGRLEGRVLLEELLQVAPAYTCGEGATRVYSEFLHGYHRVPIEFAPTR